MFRSVLVSLALLPLASISFADWSPDFRVTTNPSVSVTETDGGRNVIVDEGFVMVVWSDSRDGNLEVYFRERVGGVWSDPVRLTTNAASSMHPAIGRFPGEVRVAFQDDRTGHPEIWMKRKVLGTWGADSCLTCDEFESARPALDPTGVHLVWEETKDGNREIYYRERFENGTWQPEFRVSTDDGASSHPTVATPATIDLVPGVPPLQVLVAWQDDRDGNLEIYARLLDEVFFPDWSIEGRVSHDAGNSRFPSATVAYGCSDAVFPEPHVAWQDDRDGNEEIYFGGGFNGAIWTIESRLTTTSTPSERPSLFSSFHWTNSPFGPVLCAFPAIAWEERTEGGAAAELRYWVPYFVPETTLTDFSARAARPSLAIDHRDDDIEAIRRSIVVWEDTRDGNPEIYLSELEGDFTVTDVTVLPPATNAMELGRGRPNPFRTSVELVVRLASETVIDVRVVNAAGREVAALFHGTKPAGSHPFSWNGETATGRPAAAGTYFVVVSDAEGSVTRRIVRLR